MTIWRMRISCWIPKATRTHSEYVILLFHSKNCCANAPRRHVIRTLPVLVHPVSITHAHILLLYHLSMRHIFASIHSSGPCVISHVHVFIFLSFIHDYCRFCLNVNSGYSSLFQLRIIPAFIFTLANGTVFLHRQSYSCLLCHTHFSVSLIMNMLHFLSQSRAFAPFFFTSTTSFA